MDLGVGGLGQGGVGVKVLGRGGRQPQHRKQNQLKRRKKSFELTYPLRSELWTNLDISG